MASEQKKCPRCDVCAIVPNNKPLDVLFKSGHITANHITEYCTNCDLAIEESGIVGLICPHSSAHPQKLLKMIEIDTKELKKTLMGRFCTSCKAFHSKDQELCTKLCDVPKVMCKRCGEASLVVKDDGVHCTMCFWIQRPDGSSLGWEPCVTNFVCSYRIGNAVVVHRGGWDSIEEQLFLDGKRWPKLNCRDCNALHPDHRTLWYKRCEELCACVRCGRLLSPTHRAIGTSDMKYECNDCKLAFSEWQTVEGFIEEPCFNCGEQYVFAYVGDDMAKDELCRICRSCGKPHPKDVISSKNFGKNISRRLTCSRCEKESCVNVALFLRGEGKNFGSFEEEKSCLSCTYTTRKNGIEYLLKSSSRCIGCNTSNWIFKKIVGKESELLVRICKNCKELCTEDKNLIMTVDTYQEFVRRYVTKEQNRPKNVVKANNSFFSKPNNPSNNPSNNLPNNTLKLPKQDAEKDLTNLSKLYAEEQAKRKELEKKIAEMSLLSSTLSNSLPIVPPPSLTLGISPPNSDSIQPPNLTTSQQNSTNKSDEGTCVICLSNKSCYILLECGHVALCESCVSNSVGKPCPVCRVVVITVKKCFIV